MPVDTDVNVQSLPLSFTDKNFHPLHVVIKNTFGVQPLKSLMYVFVLLIWLDPDVCRLLMGEVSVVWR